MKFIVFVSVLGFSCYLAAGLNDNLPASSLNTKLDYNGIANGISENNDMTRLYWPELNDIIRKVLSTWLNVQCFAREFLTITDATLKFVDDIKECGANSTKLADTLNATVYNVISKVNDIIQINTRFCYDSSSKDRMMDSKISSKYFEEYYKKLIELKDKINVAVSKLETASALGICAEDATKELQEVLMEFPKGIEKCVTHIDSDFALRFTISEVE